MSVVKYDNPLLEHIVSNINQYPNTANLPLIRLIPMCLELNRLTTGGEEKLNELANSLESMASIILQSKNVA